MNLYDIIILSVALGMDCLLVSFSQGLIFKKKKRLNSFMLAVTMGLFQGLMPCISYTFTNFVQQYIEPYSKWLVFVIFMCLGLKFIVEAFYEKEEELCCIGWKCLLGMGIATSIDALAVGITYAFLESSNWLVSFFIIGILTFIISIFGVKIGNRFGNKYERKAEITGKAGIAKKAEKTGETEKAEKEERTGKTGKTEKAKET